jgi:exopolyphosphatase/guanosine-5'-triphosphate,3'-diphosphate pyrophosphatase
MEAVGVSPLLADERLIGTGGTVRNLAKVDRRMQGDYPISRLHGYTIDRRRLDDAAALLAGQAANDRGRVPGLNGDRADSIVGGALVVQAVMDRLLAVDFIVAGYGLREGMALRSVTEEPASVADVQRASVVALGRRFTSWDGEAAERRAALVGRLLAVLAPGLSPEAALAAMCAARLLDIGASIDYYRRYAHSARIVADANLDGFPHRTLALLSAALWAVGEREASVKSYGPLLVAADQPVIEQIAAAVGLTDALVRYGSAGVEHALPERSNGHVTLATAVVDAWPLEAPTSRAERAFGLSLELGSRTHAT